MSLINDALKRAGQTSARPAAPPPPAPVAMCPVEKVSTRRLPFFILPAALVIFCAALVILVKGLSGGKPINAVANPPVVSARTPAVTPTQPPARTAATSAPGSSAVAVAARAPTPASSNAARPQAAAPRPAAVPVASASAAPVVPRVVPATVTAPPPVQRTVVSAAPTPQSFKLGGIFYRANNPSAVVNNRTVSVGERLGNARVKTITRDTVVLEFPGGQLLELTL